MSVITLSHKYLHMHIIYIYIYFQSECNFYQHFYCLLENQHRLLDSINNDIIFPAYDFLIWKYDRLLTVSIIILKWGSSRFLCRVPHTSCIITPSGYIVLWQAHGEAEPIWTVHIEGHVDTFLSQNLKKWCSPVVNIYIWYIDIYIYQQTVSV